MKYLNKAGKYISNHRLLFIICVVAAFIIMANIATYIANYEYFSNCNKKEQFTNNKNKKEPFANENGMSNFMEEQMKNMQNSNK